MRRLTYTVYGLKGILDTSVFSPESTRHLLRLPEYYILYIFSWFFSSGAKGVWAEVCEGARSYAGAITSNYTFFFFLQKYILIINLSNTFWKCAVYYSVYYRPMSVCLFYFYSIYARCMLKARFSCLMTGFAFIMTVLSVWMSLSQVHIQTIGILVSEKTELQTALQYTQHAARQKSGVCVCVRVPFVFC